MADGTTSTAIERRLLLAATTLIERGWKWTGDRWKEPQRSDDHHRLFFAIIREAFKNWPESHKFQPGSAEELRGWLLVEVGHCASGEVLINNSSSAAKSGAVAALRAMHGITKSTTPYKRMVEIKEGIKVFVPRSIAKGEVSKREFEDVSRKVFEIVEVTLGCSIDQLKHQMQWGVQ